MSKGPGFTPEQRAALRAAMGRRGWSKKVAAARSGLSPTHVGDMLRGEFGALTNAAASLCAALGLRMVIVPEDAQIVEAPPDAKVVVVHNAARVRVE